MWLQHTRFALWVAALIGVACPCVLLAEPPGTDMRQAQEFWEQKNYAATIAVLNQVLAQDKTNVEAYIMRANSFAWLHLHKRAIDDLTEAIGLKPEDGRAYGLRAREYMFSGNFNQAIDDETNAINFHSPYLVDHYLNRAVAYSAVHDYKNAIDDCDRVIASDPTKAAAYALRGSAYSRRQMYEKAISDLTKAISLDPDNPHTYGDRSYAYKKLGKTDLAEKDDDKARQVVNSRVQHANPAVP
jgi:tetratricopeptide (TPR) repeat protein